MQDEVTKHTRKIFKTIRNPSHSLSEKLTEIAIEIGIIVFAVTLSIWLHSWSEHRHEQEEAHKFLRELKEDLKNDAALLNENQSTAKKLDDDFRYILSLKKGNLNDTIIGPHTDLDFLGTNFNVGRYEGFKSSGKIGTIENDALKNKILAYYQQTIPNLVLKANFINAEHTKILDVSRNEIGNLSLNEFLTTKKMHLMYTFLEYNYRAAITNYAETVDQVNEMIAEIDKEAEE
jgi:hypothetical protein